MYKILLRCWDGMNSKPSVFKAGVVPAECLIRAHKHMVRTPADISCARLHHVPDARLPSPLSSPQGTFQNSVRVRHCGSIHGPPVTYAYSAHTCYFFFVTWHHAIHDQQSNQEATSAATAAGDALWHCPRAKFVEVCRTRILKEATAGYYKH